MTGYVRRLGIALDNALNVLLLNGDPDQTISYHAAVAEDEGERWACWLCWALARLVQAGHCAQQLEPAAEPTSAALRAGLLLVSVVLVIGFAAHALFGVVRHLI